MTTADLTLFKGKQKIIVTNFAYEIKDVQRSDAENDVPLLLGLPVALQVPEDIDSSAIPLSNLIKVIGIILQLERHSNADLIHA